MRQITRRIFILLALFAISFALACADDPSGGDTTLHGANLAGDDTAGAGDDDGGDVVDDPVLPKGDVHLVFHPTSSRPTTHLVGWNVGRGTWYAPPDDPVHPEWRTPALTEAFARLAQVRAASGNRPLVRFSGLQIDGTLGGDGYHFWDLVRQDRAVTPEDNMAPFEFFAIVDEIDADPRVTLNFGSGTADEAARYVMHLNGESAASDAAQARQHWGHPAPYDVPVFEIGNESYGFWNTGFLTYGPYSYANPLAIGGGDPDWHGRPASGAANFSARALAYIDAVLAVEPAARFRVPLTQASMTGWGGLNKALGALEPLLQHPAVEAVVIHHYQVDDAAELGYPERNAPAIILAGSEIFAPLFHELRLGLAAIPRFVPLDIVVTEYHVAGAFSKLGFKLGDTAAVGLGIADMLLLYDEMRIKDVCQHMAINFDDSGELLFEPWYNPFRIVDGELAEMPSYRVTRMIAERLHGRSAKVDVQSPLRAFDSKTKTLSYPIARAAGFVDVINRHASVIVLNREFVDPRPLTIDAPEEWSVASVTAYAPGTVDKPGPAAAPVEIPWTSAGARTSMTAPPHALIAIDLVREP
ncbi:hypothetical protein K8I61_07955 [bacterium]|nr:hypothetical protein [bacterium]